MKRRLFTIILLFVISLTIQASPQAEIDKANKAYMAGFFENSIPIYEKVIADGLASPNYTTTLGTHILKPTIYLQPYSIMKGL